jgi:hypothetical protein
VGWTVIRFNTEGLSFIYLSLAVLGFELGALHFLDKLYHLSQAPSPLCFSDTVSSFLLGASLRPLSSYFYLSYSWDHRHEPPHSACFLRLGLTIFLSRLASNPSDLPFSEITGVSHWAWLRILLLKQGVGGDLSL